MTGEADIERVANRLRATAEPSTLESYASGYDLGMQWASERATWRDLKTLAGQSREAWFKLHLKPNHSLIDFLAEEAWDCEPPAGSVKLGREPFVEGVVAGAAYVHDSVLSRLLVRP